MTGLRLLLAAVWLVVAAVTLWALAEMGLGAGLETFFGDLSHPWRAQFYADLEAQLIVLAAWIAWREGSAGAGLAGAAATMLLGALFTLPYLLLASMKAKGDPAALLLGPRRAAARA